MNCQSSTGARRLFPVVYERCECRRGEFHISTFLFTVRNLTEPPDGSQLAVGPHCVRHVVLDRPAVN